MCHDVGNMCRFMFHTYYIASIFAVERGNHIHWYMLLSIPFYMPSTSLFLCGLDHILFIWHWALRLNWGDSLTMFNKFRIILLWHWSHSSFHPTYCQYSALPPHITFIITMYTLNNTILLLYFIDPQTLWNASLWSHGSYFTSEDDLIKSSSLFGMRHLNSP